MDTATFYKVMEDLRSHDVAIRLANFGRLSEVAKTLGPERVRSELLPYLNEFIDDEDSVLLELCHQLTHITALVGGPQHLSSTLEILETLVCAEDVSVRSHATDVLVSVMQQMSDEDMLRHALPVLRHLVCSEWHTARVSAAALLPAMYPRLPAAGIQRELRTVFSSLCVDETPMVRRAVCAEFPAFVSVVSEADVVCDLLGAFARLSKDDQDSVRLICVDACVALLDVFRRHEAVHRLLPFVFALCTDRSWRVRYVVADRFPQVLSAIGAGTLTGDEVADCYNKLLLDPEGEVRTAAARQLYSTCVLLGADRTSRCLLKAVKQLATDTCQFTRAALGKEIMFLALVLSNKDFLAHVLPLFLLMLKDSHSQVRINLISRLEFVQPVLGEDTLAQALLPAVCQLALDPQWRVRLAIIRHVPRLAAQLGARFFEVKLADLAMSWVGDTVSCVRDAAGSNFMQLTQVFGSPWCVRHLVPRLDHLSTRKSFLYRVTALSILQTLLRVIRLDSACQHLLPILTRLSEDAVPNVRFVAIKAIRVLLCRLDGRVLPPMESPNDAVLTASLQGDDDNARTQNNASRAPSAPVPVRSATKSGDDQGEPLADIEADTRAETDRTVRATEEAKTARTAIWARVTSLMEDQDRDVAYAASQLEEEVRGG